MDDSEKTKCIITSASSKFFPSLINMLGSLHINYPNHPKVYVYDIGLFYTFRKELEKIKWVEVINIPHFSPFWRACYTWKTYIFTKPLADLNFYIDAGCQILKPLDEIFSEIDNDGYFTVDQDVKGIKMMPVDYIKTFNIENATLNENAITAGIFGFKKAGSLSKNLDEMFEYAKKGYCLGFSKTELWKNKGVNKTDYVRDCEYFRHDTTLLTIFARKNNPSYHSHSALQYAGWTSPNDHKDQVIWNLRMNYKKLKFIDGKILNNNLSLISLINRIWINVFLIFKNLRLNIKKIYAK